MLKITSKLCLSKKQNIICGKIGKTFTVQYSHNACFLCGLEWNEQESNNIDIHAIFFILDY